MRVRRVLMAGIRSVRGGAPPPPPDTIPVRGRSDDPPGGRRGRIAGIGRARGLDEQEVDLLLRHRAMLDPLGHYEEIARRQMDLAVAQLDREMALEDEEEVVRIVVLV